MIDLNELVKTLEDNKLKNISVYNLSNEDRYVVIASSMSAQTSKAVSDILKEKYDYSEKIEGYTKGEWIVFDFEKLTLHIFLPKVREKYNLDKLYKPMKLKSAFAKK